MPHRNVNPNAQQALELLKEGNQRFTQGLRSVETIMRSRDLAELAEKGQSPFVILLSCADSRVPAEILFDRGAGDIFVCRVAGNIVTPAILGSIEFAAQQFGTPLCVVMGHTRCGAIKATLQNALSPPAAGSKVSPHIEAIVREITPAARLVLERHTQASDPTTLARCTDEAAYLNVEHTIQAMQERSEVIRDLAAAGKLLITGAVCDIANGRVDFMPIQRAAAGRLIPRPLEA